MKCPKCSADNFYVGVLTAGECENPSCQLHKTTSIDTKLKPDVKLESSCQKLSWPTIETMKPKGFKPGIPHKRAFHVDMKDVDVKDVDVKALHAYLHKRMLDVVQKRETTIPKQPNVNLDRTMFELAMLGLESPPSPKNNNDLEDALTACKSIYDHRAEHKSRRQTGRTTKILRGALAQAVCGQDVFFVAHNITMVEYAFRLAQKEPLKHLIETAACIDKYRICFMSGGRITFGCQTDTEAAIATAKNHNEDLAIVYDHVALGEY